MGLGWRPAGAAALALCLVVGGCAPPAPAKHRAAVIIVDKLAFGPAPTGLQVGDTVTWENHDIFQHSATAKDGAFDVELPPGGKASVTLTRAGLVEYYCRYHPGMTGRIQVLS